MRITGFHLDGFGIYHNQGVQEIPPGLTLFLGENEAGKTTLMEFIRAVLFGFVKQRKGGKPINEYPPWRGGQHGGRLQVVTADSRRLTISRAGRDATLTEAGNPPETFKEPGKLLGGIDRNTFVRIFAIGLEDMQSLDVLSPEGVGSRLFAAGAGLRGASVPGAIKYLDDELGKLVTSTGVGKTRLIGQLSGRLKEVEAELRDIRGQAGEYARGHKRLAELEARIKASRQEAEAISRRRRRLEQLEQAREAWVKRGAARDKAGSLEYARNFPPEGLNRFHSINEALEDLRARQQQRRQEIAAWEQQLSLLSVDQAVLDQRQAIEVLLEDRKMLSSALKDLPLAENRVKQAEEEFRRRLQDLGLHWTEEMLERVDTSVPVRHQASEFGRQLDAAARHEEQALAWQQTRQEAAAEAQEAAVEAQRRLQQLAPPPLVDWEELQARQDAVRVIRSLLHQRDLVAGRLEAGGKSLEENQKRMESLQRQAEAGTKPLPGWLGLATAALVAILAGWFLSQHSYLPAALSLAGAAGLVILLESMRRRQKTDQSRRISQIQQEIQEVEKFLQARRQEISRLEEDLEAVSREMARISEDAGLPPPKDLMQWEQVAEDLEQVAEQWRARQIQEQEAAKAAAHAEKCLKKLEEARAAAGEALVKHQALAAKWEAWLAAENFSPTLRPEGFATVLQAVESARSTRRHMEEPRLRLAQMTDYLAQTRARIRRVLDACGKAPLSGEAGLEDLDALRRDLEANLKTLKKKMDLEAKLEAAADALASLQSQEQEQEKQRLDLLEKAGAADDEEFLRLSEAYREWRELIKTIDGEEIKLLTIAGNPEILAALEKELQETDPLQLQEEEEQLETRLQWINDSIDADQDERGGLKNRLAELAQSEKLGELLLRQRSLQEEVTQATRRWAALAVCRHLLEQARLVYERERQPQVITEARRFLRIMTRMPYRLVSSVGEEAIHLEDPTLRRKEEIAWSAGLADQVYLSIRLGLAREFSRHAEPLPLIMDDVLLKFDPGRRLGAARVILEAARDQQVLFFSCHPEFGDIFAQVSQEPEHQGAQVMVYHIDDGVIGLRGGPGDSKSPALPSNSPPNPL